MFYNQHLGNVKYIKVIQGQNKYLIEDFKNLSGCYVFATKKKTEALMQEISSDHYSFESFENNNYIKFEDGFPINDYYSFKIIKPEQIISIPYNFNTISSITPDALNSNFEALKETLKKIQESYNNQIVKIDSDIATVMLPNLDDDEVWVRKGDTYRGFNIGSLEANIKEMLDEIKRIRDEIIREMEDNKNRHLAEIKGKFDQEVAEGKANVIATGEQQVQLVTQTGNTKIEELNIDFTKKNNTLIETGDTKNQLLIDTFNSKNQELINTGEQKKSEIIQVGDEKVSLVTQEGNKQVQRVTTQGDIEVQRIIDTGIDGKVSKLGDSTKGTITCQIPNEGFGLAFTSLAGIPATNRTGIFGGNDYTGFEKPNNIDIRSWNGTSFSASTSDEITISFNNRTGEANFKGNITSNNSPVITNNTQFMNKRQIIVGENWNSITNTGVYDVRNASGANRPSTYPFGILIVHKFTENFLVQQYFPDQESISSFYRVCYNGVWRYWNELTTNLYRGIIECGQYIDMHRSGSNSDYDARLTIRQGEATFGIEGVNRLVVGVKDACLSNVAGLQIRTGAFNYAQGQTSMQVNFSEAFPSECIAVIIQECHSDPSWVNNVIKPLWKNNSSFGVASNTKYGTFQTFIAIGR